MNTGFLGPAVATVLTACGIETSDYLDLIVHSAFRLQQYLPLAVLKLVLLYAFLKNIIKGCNSTYRLRY